MDKNSERIIKERITKRLIWNIYVLGIVTGAVLSGLIVAVIRIILL